MNMKDYVDLRSKKYPIISKPVPHIVVPTEKKLHGWAKGKRECTSERMLINPYNGCSIGCFYCYSLSYPGYFQIFRNKNIIIVAEDFDREISKQLDSIDVASCGYLSPITDPFQPVNNKYKLSEKIIDEFVKRNIPIQVTTKSKIPENVFDKISRQKYSFVQVSILTLKEKLRKILAPGGADTNSLLSNIKKAEDKNIFSVARIDPIFPYITDDFKDLEILIKKIRDLGTNHIIASILDIPLNMKKVILKKIKLHFGIDVGYNYNKLYRENIDGWLNADIDYRKRIFDFLKKACEKQKISFSLCMEYEMINKKCKGLNQKFSDSVNCDGVNIPVYVRKKEKFYPVADCYGNCLNCKDAKCGMPDLAMGRENSKKNWKLNDYKRWSKNIKQKTLNFSDNINN